MVSGCGNTYTGKSLSGVQNNRWNVNDSSLEFSGNCTEEKLHKYVVSSDNLHMSFIVTYSWVHKSETTLCILIFNSGNEKKGLGLIIKNNSEVK